VEGVEEPLGRSLAIAAKLVRLNLDERLASIGSSLQTHLVLRDIETNPGVTQRELARHVGIEGPTLTHHLDRLAADGLVERIRGIQDRRTVCPALTAKGKAHLRRSRKVAEGFQVEMDAVFTAAELATLREGLNRLTEHYRRIRHDDHRARGA
jgi:MarR family transcriptional regulator, transcriptional regulator for hemolysin